MFKVTLIISESLPKNAFSFESDFDSQQVKISAETWNTILNDYELMIFEVFKKEFLSGKKMVFKHLKSHS